MHRITSPNSNSDGAVSRSVTNCRPDSQFLANPHKACIAVMRWMVTFVLFEECVYWLTQFIERGMTFSSVVRIAHCCLFRCKIAAILAKNVVFVKVRSLRTPFYPDSIGAGDMLLLRLEEGDDVAFQLALRVARRGF